MWKHTEWRRSKSSRKMFQKDLIVWKRIGEINMNEIEEEFQKDLIVWKQRGKREGIDRG